MTYHYGGSSSSQRTTTSSSSQGTATGTGQSTRVQRTPAPPGFHYMPDGTLMSNEEHARLYNTPTTTEVGRLAPGTEAPLAPLEGTKTRFGCTHVEQTDPTLPYYGWMATNYDPLADGCDNGSGFPIANSSDCCNWDLILGLPMLGSSYDTAEQQPRDDVRKNARKPGCAQETCNDTNSSDYGCYHKPFYGLNAPPYNNPIFYHPSNEGCPNAFGFPQINNIDCCECDTPVGLPKLGSDYVQPPVWDEDDRKWAFGCAQEIQSDPNLQYYGWYATNYSQNFPGCDDGSGVATPNNTDCCEWDIILGLPRLHPNGVDVAPRGYHYMSNGSLMSNKDHVHVETNEIKEAIIKEFSIDTSNIPYNGGLRNFIINGDDEAAFTMQAKDDSGNYYNFITNTWSTTVSRSNRKKIGPGSYRGFINFTQEALRSSITYTVELFAESTDCSNTKIKLGSEVRNVDGSLNKNLSGALNEHFIEKEINQTISKTVTLSCIAPTLSDSSEVWNGATPSVSSSTGAAVISFKETEADGKIPFTISITAASGKSISIIRQPTENDFAMIKSINIGSSPELIPGENIYPTVTGTDTVNGAVEGATSITMDSAVATKMAVGDRVTGNAALNAGVFTVASLDSTNVFSISSAIDIADAKTLSFSNHVQYRWPVSDVAGLSEGMILDPSSTRGGNVTTGTEISSYIINANYDVIDVNDCEVEQETITYNEKFVRGVVKTGPILSMGSNGIVTSQAGTLVFNKQQVDALKSDSGLYVYGYGPESIIALSYGAVVSFSNLKAEILTDNIVTTTATSDTSRSASTTVGVSEQDGILDDISLLSVAGIGGDVLVTNKAAASGSGNITLQSAKEIKNGSVLQFKGAAKTITVTGHVELSGSILENKTVYLDVESFLACA